MTGVLILHGEPLTSERIKAQIERVFGEHGAYADEFIVSHGPETPIGHEVGHGPSVYTDLARTYVVGEIQRELRE